MKTNYTLREPTPWSFTPKYVWKVTIGNPDGLTISYEEGKYPCWFHRKMQEFCLGFKWKKIK